MNGEIPASKSSKALTADGPSDVTLLLPVWGDQFTRRFLEFCLPTLLSPRNIPALARELPCRFVLLSSENDEAAIRSHPAWRRLEQLCVVEIALIDDLITGRNHTATITMGFERALRQMASTIRHTCFIFLMSDYLVADGSLATVLAAVRKGGRAVLAGNFQIVAEDAVPLLKKNIRPGSPEIILQSRDLVRTSLAHLHPATVANIVDCGLVHNAHCNRLFWQVDQSSLIGRFFLMHPIAIHPEVEDFTVGSSWDYSFVPELCPSGNVVALTDSDDYLVVEIQGRLYEHEHLRLGPFDERELAQSLSEWTTARHRLNIEQKLIFHASDLPRALPQAIEQSNAFISQVQEWITTPPMSHRDHPYWKGSLAAHKRDARRPLSGRDWRLVLEQQRPKYSGLLRRTLQSLALHLLRSPLEVARTHPFWPDYQLGAKAARDALELNQRVLLIAEDPVLFARWVSQIKGDVSTISSSSLLLMAQATYRSLAGTFDTVLFVLGERSLVWCDTLIKHAGPLLKDGGTCGLLFVNERSRESAVEFSRSFVREAARLWVPGASIQDIRCAQCSPLRWCIREIYSRLRRRVATGSITASVAAFAGVPLLIGAYVVSHMVQYSDEAPPGIWSSVFVTLHLPAMSTDDLPSFGNRPLQLAGAEVV